MKRITLRAIAVVATVVFSGAVCAAEYGSAEEAKAMLDRVIAAVKADGAGALAKFNAGDPEFKDRDLYPFCADADGILTAHPTLLGKQLRDIKDVDGKPLGQEMLAIAEEGKVAEVSYKWPRPGATDPIAKISFVTKIGEQTCGVGYYK